MNKEEIITVIHDRLWTLIKTKRSWHKNTSDVLDDLAEALYEQLSVDSVGHITSGRVDEAIKQAVDYKAPYPGWVDLENPALNTVWQWFISESCNGAKFALFCNNTEVDEWCFYARPLQEMYYNLPEDFRVPFFSFLRKMADVNVESKRKSEKKESKDQT